MNRNFLLITFLGIVAVGLIVYFFMMRTDETFFSEKERSPCAAPLTVRVGDVDERFNISKEEVEALLQDVAKIWSDAAKSSVVEYNENGEIAVNLVYAEEQRLSDREQQYRDRMADEEFSISAHEKEYERMEQQYEQDVQKYEQDSRKVQRVIDQLNRWVSQKNDTGGFNEQDLQRYEEQKSKIETMKRQLARQESVLQRKANEINDKIAFLNEKIDGKNQLIEEYNRTFSGERQFTQGQYEWNAVSRNINVFHFIDNDELRLVLAHEMGHALGINHVDNPQSVMYRLMGEQDRPGIELTTEDIQALQNVCTTQ